MKQVTKCGGVSPPQFFQYSQVVDSNGINTSVVNLNYGSRHEEHENPVITTHVCR